MEKFPESIQFKYPWREYQSRVLAELEAHLTDNHLHLIAPPGSGKTILGLEVMLRLNRPTLILAPSIAIRNQWIHRFCELFLQKTEVPDWISRDIKAPKFLTVATYQALHAVYQGIPEEEEVLIDSPTAAIHAIDLPTILQEQGVQTIIVDEAHHLKNAWWKSLMKVKNALNPVVVGLTATPPYDVPYAEWKRYLELNGPVDTEITVPELVSAGDLAPHQDFVYFSAPTNNEAEELTQRRKLIDELYTDLCEDQELLNTIQKHRFFSDSEEAFHDIFKNVEAYSAMIIYMNHAGIEIQKETLDVIAVKQNEIPDLDYFWMESLLRFFLFGKQDQFDAEINLQKRIISRLKKCSALERTSVNLLHNKKVDELLSKSISKLDSVVEIVSTEHRALGGKLRMVILTDFIRKEFLTKSNTNNLTLTKMGVVPIFESLRRSTKNEAKLGVLTGSMVFLPVTALPAFERIASHYVADPIVANNLPYDSSYLSISLTQAVRKDIVHIVTQVFEQGEIEVLIGTKALLGEGWDAPSINSLILASLIGSYVSSNQMRGRAIRTNPQTPNKTANIWHLVCLDPNDKNGGADIELLRRRFRAFAGVNNSGEVIISNNFNRLELLNDTFRSSRFEDIIRRENNRMTTLAETRSSFKDRWDEAIHSNGVLIEEAKIPFPRKERTYAELKQLYYGRTIRNMFATLSTAIAVYLESVLEVLRPIFRSQIHVDLSYLVFLILGGGVLFFGGRAYWAFRSLLLYRDISRDIESIGVALMQTLHQYGHIKTPLSELTVITDSDSSGGVTCHLEGGTTYEKSTFIKSLLEILEVVDNPRYIIIRKSSLFNLIAQRDYHSVPELLSGKQELAEAFASRWQAKVGRCELIYAHSTEGRIILLKSRIRSLAREFDTEPMRESKWQ